MKKMKSLLLAQLFIGFVLFVSCDANGDFLIFSVQNDSDLGEEIALEIENDPTTYPIMSRVTYSAAYEYIDEMFNEILSSEEVTYRDDFNWEIFLIDDDQTLNAFATPGGKVYVYTGLIYFLDKEDDLAGVIGHEIAHADRRHSSKQLQTQYGISVLLSIVAGDQSELVQNVLGSLVGVGALAFSRSDEAEADDYSVQYLADTKYACNGAATFFEKLESLGSTGTIEFLSTHPSPENRVSDINTTASETSCNTTPVDGGTDRYLAFRSLLP